MLLIRRKSSIQRILEAERSRMLLSDAELVGKTALVVDDQELARDLTRRYLQQMGLHVTTASSGKASQEALTKFTPDIIILDAHMPHMSGPELCRILRTGYTTRDIPIIFVTGDERAVMITQCLSSGGSDIVHKPMLRALFQHRVRTQLTLKHLMDEAKVRKLKET